MITVGTIRATISAASRATTTMYSVGFNVEYALVKLAAARSCKWGKSVVDKLESEICT